jgi:transcriptional regulator with XRE-family HTH domain
MIFMIYSEIIVRRIETLCKQRGIAYNKLATMCGLNQSTIDNIVRGVTKDPRIQTLHHIALGLNMTLAEFLDFKELNDFSFDEERE